MCMYTHACTHARIRAYRHAHTPPPLKDEDPTVLVRVLEQAHAGGHRVAAAKAAKSLSATEERANTLGNAWPIALHHLDPQTHPAEHSLAVSVLLSKLASGRLELSTAAWTGASVPFSPFYALMRRCPSARYVRILSPTSYTSDLLPPTPPTSDLRPPTSYLRPPTSDPLPPTSYLLPPTSDLRPPTSDLLHQVRADARASGEA